MERQQRDVNQVSSDREARATRAAGTHTATCWEAAHVARRQTNIETAPVRPRRLLALGAEPSDHRPRPRSGWRRMIIDSVLDVAAAGMFMRLEGFHQDGEVFLKLEGLNAAGSIKLKPARAMIEDLERRGRIAPGRHRVIESSSGSLGVALSVVCRAKGYAFTCVTDPNVSPAAERLMRAYGTEVVVVRVRDANGGYLGSRLEYIERRLRSDRRLVWLNQYANHANPLSHYQSTAPEIREQFPDLELLFIGAGTTATLVGCAKYFAEHSPATRIIAVDTEGSVTFGRPGGRRWIPGLGTSRRPEIASLSNVADVVIVPERRAVAVCHEVLRRYGLLAGGSTGTVLAAVQQYAGIVGQPRVVAISADFGDRYLNSVYDPAWVAAHFGDVGCDGRVHGRLTLVSAAEATR